MARIGQVCPGDCSKCELLAEGHVDMVPCILDQIFQRVRKNEQSLEAIYSLMPNGKGMPKLADTNLIVEKEEKE